MWVEYGMMVHVPFMLCFLPLVTSCCAGDVTAAEVQAIKDKYNPNDVDMREFRAAKAAGTLNQYWAKQADKLKALTGDAAPPAIAA